MKLLLLLAPIFGSMASAYYYIEVTNAMFPELGPWQLCHGIAVPTEKYELSLWAVDPKITSCKKTGGDPEFHLLGVPDNKPPNIAKKEPGRYFLGGGYSLPWETKEGDLPAPVIMTEKTLYVGLKFGSSPLSEKNIPAVFQVARMGELIDTLPQPGDIFRFVGDYNNIIPPTELGFQIDLVQTGEGDYYAGDSNYGRITIFRSESFPSQEKSAPKVRFRVTTKEAIESMGGAAFEPGKAVTEFLGGVKQKITDNLANARDSMKESVNNVGKAVKKKVANTREAVKDKVRDAKSAVGQKIKTGLEKGIAKMTGGGNRMHIHGIREEEEEKEGEQDWMDMLAGSDSDSPDPSEQGMYYEGEQIEPGLIDDDYVDDVLEEIEKMEIQNKPKSIEVFEVEQAKKYDENDQL